MIIFAFIYFDIYRHDNGCHSMGLSCRYFGSSKITRLWLPAGRYMRSDVLSHPKRVDSDALQVPRWIYVISFQPSHVSLTICLMYNFQYVWPVCRADVIHLRVPRYQVSFDCDADAWHILQRSHYIVAGHSLGYYTTNMVTGVRNILL